MRLTTLALTAACIFVTPLAASNALASTSETTDAESRAPRAQPPAGLHVDVEIDPTAYVLRGHSLHVGIGWRRVRLDLGAYGMTLPRAIHGNEGFGASFDGYGAKLQWFPFAEQTGAFVGVDAGLARPLVQLEGTDLSRRSTQLSVGVNAGWRFDLIGGLYATPWIGVGYNVGAKDVTLGGQTFEQSKWTVFPAIHLGYRFL